MGRRELAEVKPLSRVLVIACLSLLFWSAASILWSAPSNAVPAAPDEITLEQPDGTTFQARLFGDEFNNGFETTEGYTIVLNSETEAYEYAEQGAEGELQPSGTRAEDAPPSDVQEGLRTEPELRADAFQRAGELEDPELAAPNTGSQKNLVLLVQFADQSSVGSTPAQWSDKFFGSTNSVRDYYEEVSYGNLFMDPATESNGTANDGVVGWLTLNQNHPNTAGNTGTANRLLTRDAINAANQYVNYASYDANGDGYISSQELHVTVIVAGYEAAGWSQWGKSVWGHNWALFGSERPTVDGVVLGEASRGGGYSQFGEMQGDHMATIGIMVHELGHDLKLPDLYDTDQSSEGVGNWSVMGGGTWLRTTGYSGSMPAHPDPFSKWYQGWLTPEKLSGSNLSTSIQQVETSATVKQILDNPNGVDWTFGGSSGTGEYFLVENRQRVGYDAGLPGTGLLVWHIDETRTSDNSANATDTRRLVDVEEADGLGHLDSNTNRGDAGDPYPGSGNKTVFNGTSNPNSNLYSGSSSNVGISNISGSSSTMTATISTPGAVSGPPNDAFASAEILTGASDTTSGTNQDATKETGEPNHAGNTGGKSVWYRWTPQTSGTVTIKTASSDFDTLLGVYTGSAVNSLTQVASNDDVSLSDRTSSVSFAATAGTTYQIAVDGYNSATGSITLNLSSLDSAAPLVSSVTPIDGQTGISLGTPVTVTFSEEMNPSTINTSTVSLYQKYWYQVKRKKGKKIRKVWTYRWVPVSASVSCNSSSACTTATLDPTNPLVANTNYLAAVTTGAKDEAGNTLAQAKYWTFTTGTATGSQQPKK